MTNYNQVNTQVVNSFFFKNVPRTYTLRCQMATVQQMTGSEIKLFVNWTQLCRINENPNSTFSNI